MSLPQMLRSESERDFQLALTGLSSMPKDEAVGLLEQLALEPDGTFRSRAIDGMMKISPERAEALAISHLNDSESFVRVNAIHVLFLQLGSRDAAPLIAQLLATDPDEVVRSWAALALGELGDASVLPILTIAAEQDTGTNHEGVPICETAINSIKMVQSRLADQGKE
jgi:HEAT repeat protein